MTRNFFLYGTLQPQAGTRMGRWIAKRLVSGTPGSVPGRIIAVPAGDGWFPALVRGGAGQRVYGTLAQLALSPGDMALLDRYEGREYRRAVLPARPVDGARRTVQAWIWRLPEPAGAQAVRGGDFLAWLKQTGRRPFTTLRNGA